MQAIPDNLEPLNYTRQQAADALQIGVRTLDQMIADGAIEPTRFGRRVLIHRDELNRLAREGTASLN